MVGHLLSRALGAMLAVLLVGLTLVEHRERRVQREELDLLLRETGLDRRLPSLAEQARRDPDPVRARLAAGHALLAEAADPSWMVGLEPEAARQAAALLGHHLARSQDLAATTLARRPAAWEATMMVGAGRYLGWLHRTDPRLFTARQEWEGPLLRAAELAPGEVAPLRLLCTAYLPLWRSFDPLEQERLLASMRRCFQDAPTFRRSMLAWMAVARDEAQALAAVPDTPEGWDALWRLHVEARRWGEAAEAHRRGQAALERRLVERLSEAEARLAGGDPGRATAALHRLVAGLPVAAPAWPLAARALDRAAPGPPTTTQSARMGALLDRALELCALGHCPLTAEQLHRLATWAAPTGPHQDALVLLAAGDLEGAEALARRVDAALGTEPWAPYELWRARMFLQRGERAAARESLGRLPVAVATSAVVEELRREAGGEVGGEAGGEEGAATGSLAWPAIAWRWRGETARLELPLAGRRGELRVELAVVPAAGAVAQALWNGEERVVAGVAPGAELRVPVEAGGGFGLLEIQSLAGGPVRPGRVVLEPLGW